MNYKEILLLGSLAIGATVFAQSGEQRTAAPVQPPQPAYPQTTQSDPWTVEMIPTQPSRNVDRSPRQPVHPPYAQQPVLNPYRVRATVPQLGQASRPASPQSPENRERQRKLAKLQQSIREADDEAERTELGEQLKTLLSDIFEADLEQRDESLEELEARVQRLRGAIEKRRDNRDRIINLQSETIMLSAEGLAFPEGGAANGSANRFGFHSAERDDTRQQPSLESRLGDDLEQLNELPALEEGHLPSRERPRS